MSDANIPKLKWFQRLLIGCLLAPLASAATPPPSVPNAIKTPRGEKVVLEAQAIGRQIYVCEVQDGRPQWTLKGPDAVLHSSKGAIIGRHSTGPAWKLEDGSEIVGQVVAHADAPDPDAVAWLLVSVTQHSGHGALARVTSVQRVNTRGGQPPPASRCDATRAGQEASSHYTADYYFFAPKSR